MADRDIIWTDAYQGPDRRSEQRVRSDRRKCFPVVYDEFGELSDKLGEVIDVKI